MKWSVKDFPVVAIQCLPRCRMMWSDELIETILSFCRTCKFGIFFLICTFPVLLCLSFSVHSAADNWKKREKTRLNKVNVAMENGERTKLWISQILTYNLLELKFMDLNYYGYKATGTVRQTEQVTIIIL